MTVSLPGMGQLRKIMTRSRIQWVSIEWKLKKKNIQQGWCHHADLPLPGVPYSQPRLSQNSQPPQSSQRLDTWRWWIQQSLHSKNNCPVRVGPANTLWLKTWRVSEKRDGSHNSQPILSKKAQPLQGSSRVDTCLMWIQQLLQTKYNFPVRLLHRITWASITWAMAEKGKGDKLLVPRNENLKNKMVF